MLLHRPFKACKMPHKLGILEGAALSNRRSKQNMPTDMIFKASSRLRTEGTLCWPDAPKSWYLKRWFQGKAEQAKQAFHSKASSALSDTRGASVPFRT